jgi:hypothetical protein
MPSAARREATPACARNLASRIGGRLRGRTTAMKVVALGGVVT